jgi:hypothetical protein
VEEVSGNASFVGKLGLKMYRSIDMLLLPKKKFMHLGDGRSLNLYDVKGVVFHGCNMASGSLLSSHHSYLSQ